MIEVQRTDDKLQMIVKDGYQKIKAVTKTSGLQSAA